MSAEAINSMDVWDMALFLEPDVDFVQDGTRNEKIKAEREKYSKQLKDIFTLYNIEFEEISGNYTERFDSAKALIAKKLGIDTKW